MVNIYSESNQVKKKLVIKDILNDLPEWFGMPEAIQEYVDFGMEYPLYVASKNSEVVGFISLKETSLKTVEIYCMGVKKEYHHQGIGRMLMEKIKEVYREQYDYLQVKTVAKGHYRQYDATSNFYESVGFCELEVFPTLWDEWNPCLVLIQKI